MFVFVWRLQSAHKNCVLTLTEHLEQASASCDYVDYTKKIGETQLSFTQETNDETTDRDIHPDYQAWNNRKAREQ